MSKPYKPPVEIKRVHPDDEMNQILYNRKKGIVNDIFVGVPHGVSPTRNIQSLPPDGGSGLHYRRKD